jgi:hypothetical protein
MKNQEANRADRDQEAGSRCKLGGWRTRRLVEQMENMSGGRA